MENIMKLLNLLIFWPKNIASHFEWAGPLIARIIVGYTFMLTGWGKLQNLEHVTKFFTDLGIPYPNIMTPFVSGWEFIGGLFLIIGVMTRINSGALAIIMIVAIITAQLHEVMSLHDLLALEETVYLGIFTWLAICGSGKASIDYMLENRFLQKIA